MVDQLYQHTNDQFLYTGRSPCCPTNSVISLNAKVKIIKVKEVEYSKHGVQYNLHTFIKLHMDELTSNASSKHFK